MNALLLVKTADKFTELLAQDALEWDFFLPDNGDGLPGVRRLMDEFAGASGPGGTRITARKWRAAP